MDSIESVTFILYFVLCTYFLILIRHDENV